MEKEGFIYIWFDRKRKMFYVGCHWGTIDDGYICSSNRMRDAHRRRPQDFKRRILQRNISRDVLLEQEYKWLQLIKNDKLGISYYNLSKKHFGHWNTDPNSTKTVSEKISVANRGKKHPNRKSPKTFSDEHRRKMSERMKGNKYTLGRTISDEHKAAISLASKGRSVKDDVKFRISQTLMGHTHSEETRRKISETQKGKKLSDETRRKMSEARKGKPKVPGSGRKPKEVISL